MSENEQSDNADGADELSLDELFPDVELSQSEDADSGYENHEDLDRDLGELMGRPADLPEEETAAAPEPDLGDLDDLGDLELNADEALDLDAPDGPEVELEEEPSAPEPAPEQAAVPASGEVPVLEEKVDPSRMPHAGLSDDDLNKLANLLTADLEERLDGIIVEAVDHEMERVSTALKNAIHRQLKGRLPDIIAEFVSESRSL